MADEDEIDILGDCSLDGFFSANNDISSLDSGTGILRCDYTVHPQWLLDTANTACWYNDEVDQSNPERVRSASPPTTPAMSSQSNVSYIEPISGWTHTEMGLLDRGLELYGRSYARLSHHIGSKSSNQVRHYLKSTSHIRPSAGRYSESSSTDKNVANQVELDTERDTVALATSISVEEEISNDKSSNIIGDILLEDSDIPASMEEIISMVTTAEPTVKFKEKNSKKLEQNKSENRSLLKCNQVDNRSLLLSKYKNVQNSKNYVKNSKHKQFFNKLKYGNVRGKKVMRKTGNVATNNIIPEKIVRESRIKSKKIIVKQDSASGLEIVMGDGKVLPMSDKEEVIKIENNAASDSDIEVDIEEDSPSPNNNLINTDILPELNIPANNYKNGNSNCTITSSASVVEFDDNMSGDELLNFIREEVVTSNDNNVESSISMSINNRLNDANVSDELKQLLSDMSVPEEEFVFGDEISELEKYIHYEFFEGRPTKTPSRYLKIRSHIINCWKNIKPNYLSKTAARQGLRQCGDVNSIGRIHTLLEQIGAINFRCDQIKYIRPLSELLSTTNVLASSSNSHVLKREATLSTRIKKKPKPVETEGYTIAHSGQETFYNAKTAIKSNTVKSRMEEHSEQLINCLKFSDSYPEPFKIHINLSVLICMHFHAITCSNETMGLIGGKTEVRNQRKILHIIKYKPCKTAQHTRTHCEMCPVSQSEAVNSLADEYLMVVGWVHSHPGFLPLPSVQDIQTQKFMQNCFQSGVPFVGIITAPHLSTYKCLSLPNMSNEIPFEFNVQTVLNSDILHDIDIGLKDIVEIIKSSEKSDIIDINNDFVYNTNAVGIDKMLLGAKIMAGKCSPQPNESQIQHLQKLILDASNNVTDFVNN